MSAFLNGYLPLIGIIALGVAFAHAGVMQGGAVSFLNRYVYFIGIPSFVFDALRRAEPADLLDGPLLAVMILGSLGTVIAAAIILRGEVPGSRAMLASTTVFSNSLFLGLPVAIAAAEGGFAGVAAVAAVFHFAFPMLFCFGALALSGAMGSDLGGALRREVILNPLLLASLAGLGFAFTGSTLPGPLERFVGTLSLSAAPVSLFALGMFMAGVRLTHLSARPLLTTGLKILLHPALTALAALGLGLSGPRLSIALIMSGMPIAAAAFVVAERYGTAQSDVAAATVLSTVLSILTLGLIVALAA